MRRLTAVLAVFLAWAIPSFAWGPEGHRIIAIVAARELSAAARRQIRALIGSDDLGAISNWADEIKNDRPETYGWHFVDIPWNASGFSQARDCYHPSQKVPSSLDDHHNCVVDRINIFERVLADRNASRSDRAEALKFLVHFVGDIHQPLHAIGEARGGNDIQISEFGQAECGGRNCNLHLVWDVGLIRHSGLSETEYADYLESKILREGLQKHSIGGPETWANESFTLAHRIWLNDGGAVNQDYYHRNREILDQQLALGAVRLAAMLNSALR